MPKQVVVIMQKQYPFGECQQMTNQMTRVVVRKKIPTYPDTKNALMQKINLLRRLHHDCMIKLNSLLEEQQSLHLMFQYVPIKVQTWISNINEQFIQSFRQQLVRFSSFLANNDIILQFRLANVGMDQNYNAKYFLNLDFEIDHSINKEKLKSAYIRDIYNIFKPYIQKEKERERDIRKSQALNYQDNYQQFYTYSKNDNYLKKENKSQMESVIISSKDGSRKNQEVLKKPKQYQNNKSKPTAASSQIQSNNYFITSVNNPSAVQQIHQPAATQLDDSYLKQFMDVLDNGGGDNQDHDLLFSSPGMKMSSIQDKNLFKTVYHKKQKKQNQTNQNNRSFQNERSSNNIEPNEYIFEPLPNKPIYKVDLKRSQQIHSLVAEAISNSMKILDRFSNLKC